MYFHSNGILIHRKKIFLPNETKVCLIIFALPLKQRHMAGKEEVSPLCALYLFKVTQLREARKAHFVWSERLQHFMKNIETIKFI